MFALYSILPWYNFFQSDDDPSGHYFDEAKNSCEKCQKWIYTEKSCQSKNDEASKEDCHQYGEHLLSKTCFKKDITKGKRKHLLNKLMGYRHIRDAPSSLSVKYS